MEIQKQVQNSRWPVRGTLSKDLESMDGLEDRDETGAGEPRLGSGFSQMMVWVPLVAFCCMTWLWLVCTVAAIFKR